MSKPVTNPWIARIKELNKEYGRLAGTANKRLERIEKYSDPRNKMYQEKYKELKEFSYKKAARFISEVFGKKKARFRESISPTKKDRESLSHAYETYRKLSTALGAVKSFLETDTSTVAGGRLTGIDFEQSPGFKSVLENRAETISGRYMAEYGEEFSATELQKFFQAKKNEALKKAVGSSYMYVVAAKMKKLPISKKEIREYLNEHIDIKDITNRDLKLMGMKDLKEVKNVLAHGKIADLRKLNAFVQASGDPVLMEKMIKAYEEGVMEKNVFLN